MEGRDIKKIKNYFRQNPVVMLVYLYGSQAKGESKEDSDIDLAILVDEAKADSLEVQLKAISDLGRISYKEIEVQNLHAVDISFAHRVITEGKLIHSKNIKDKVEYETYVLRQYFDLKPLLDEFYSYLRERARRGLIGHAYEQLQKYL